MQGGEFGRRLPGPSASMVPPPSPSPVGRVPRQCQLPPTTHLLLNELQQRAPVHRAGPRAGVGRGREGLLCGPLRSAPAGPLRLLCSALPSSDSVTEMPAQRAHSQSTRIPCTRTRGPNSTHCLGRTVPHRTARPRTTASVQPLHYVLQKLLPVGHSWEPEALSISFRQPVLLPSLGSFL